MRQAAIDIGTNTCLLLIAESNQIGEMKIISDVHSIARLGAGVDKTKVIRQDSYERLRKILVEYKEILEEKKVDAVAAVGTSALRDATNRDEIVQKIKNECRIEIEILSSEDESIWSYHGAICGLSRSDLQGNIATLDIGGGSTELSIGINGKYVSGKSINIGAVRVTERFLSTITEISIQSARDFIVSELQKSFAENIHTNKLIAVAGTPTSLAAIKLKLNTFDAQKVNGTTLTSNELSLIMEEIVRLSPQELIKKYPAIHSSRADILPAGALIFQGILKLLKLSEVRVSTCGLRYGIMIREFEMRMKAESDEWKIEF
jgi:exopolyphosphatase/guanosine-5'-triphosphate,3'-diphosphate pyrophosphatase